MSNWTINEKHNNGGIKSATKDLPNGSIYVEYGKDGSMLLMKHFNSYGDVVERIFYGNHSEIYETSAVSGERRRITSSSEKEQFARLFWNMT